MKKSIGSAKDLLFNKVAFFTILSQWILIVVALYQRGYWEWTGHFVSDKPLYQLIVLLNIPAITLAAPFLSPTNFNSEADTLKDAVVFITTITIQWWLIGCAIKQIFFSKKSKEFNDQ